jgi:hypothetical protein
MTARNARRLYMIALAPIGIAGTLHALGTLLAPSLFTPTLAAVRDAMAHSSLQISDGANTWEAYIGFNLGMGLGTAAFCGLQLAISVRHFELVRTSRWIVLSAFAFAAVWTVIAIRYWFWAPAAAGGASALLLGVVALTLPTTRAP